MRTNRGGGDFFLHEAMKFSDLFFRPERPRDYIVLITRLAILLCLVGSISLALHSAFSPSPSATSAANFSAFRLPLPVSPAKSPASLSPSGSAIPSDLSHIMFCIAGAADTWLDRSRYTSLWWRNSTRGFVWLDKPVKFPELEYDNRFSIPVRVSDPGWIQFRYSSSRAAVRIARIIWDSFMLNLPEVRWFVMGDDDTVFFPDNLVAVLSKYDHEQMWYIGGNSESVEQDVMHSYEMAFGGGGFAISLPLAARLVSALDGCLERYFQFYGSDQRIAACVSELGVAFTKERGFHQLDIKGDPYGLLAAHPMAPLVSLHHLDHMESVFPKLSQIDSLQILMKPYEVDPPRILQHTFCYDHKRQWSISVAWGYSVQIYTYVLSAKDLGTPLQTFKTWRSSSNGPFTFNTRPLKPYPCERPVIYFLDSVEEVRNSGTKTWYSVSDNKYGDCARSRAKAVKRIMVSSMKMDPDYWSKAPRRQCCEVMEGGVGGSKEHDMSIRIRNCRSSEKITI